MKKIITTFALVTALGTAFAAGDELTIKDIHYEGGNTVVSMARHHEAYNVYTDSNQAYDIGFFTKTFKGNLTKNQVVDKASLFVDSFIVVSNGDYKVNGKVQDLASKRSKAFFANGYEGYFTELAQQLSDEK